MTTLIMKNFITHCMNNNLPTTTIIQRQGNTTNNLFSCCGITTETTQHLNKCTHKGSRGRWTAQVDAMHKWIKAWNMDPDIATILADTLLYTTGLKKLPDTMSEPNHILRNPSHGLDVYNFS